MKIESLTPELEVLNELGSRLARIRKQQGFSQTRLAEAAGIGVATLRRIEAGQDSQMESWLKLMKALGRVAAVDGLLPENFKSPMAEAKSATTQAKSHVADAGFRWGDESA